MQIALGAARGVSHIHEEGGGKFTHGNIKTSNVLLTSELDACVSDFGLVPLFSFVAATNQIVVKEEYFHRVWVNYIFAPMISCMLLTLAVPPLIAKTLNPLLCSLFVMPLILLEIRLYGKWFTGGKRVLTKNANPSQYLSIVGNFVGAILAARVGWKEPASFMFAVGFAHYAVLFVTLYQRLPTNLGLPTKLNPTFFCFFWGPVLPTSPRSHFWLFWPRFQDALFPLPFPPCNYGSYVSRIQITFNDF